MGSTGIGVGVRYGVGVANGVSVMVGVLVGVGVPGVLVGVAVLVGVGVLVGTINGGWGEPPIFIPTTVDSGVGVGLRLPEGSSSSEGLHPNRSKTINKSTPGSQTAATACRTVSRPAIGKPRETTTFTIPYPDVGNYLTLAARGKLSA